MISKGNGNKEREMDEHQFAIRQNLDKLQRLSERVELEYDPLACTSCVYAPAAGSEREHALARFFQYVPVPCVIATPTKFLHVNPAFCRVLHRTMEELIEGFWIDHVHPEDAAATSAIVNEQIDEQKGLARFTNRWRRKDGEYVRLHWWASSFASGRVYAIAVPGEA